MHPVTGIAIYFVLWWIVLFAVLPWGTRPVTTPDSETGWRGAPERPGMRKKVIATTLVTGVIWVLLYLGITSETLSFREGVLSMPQ
jgi:predicted secreted protein